MKKNEINLTDLEKDLLNNIQCNFPLVPRPFLEIANRCSITEEKCIKTLKKLSSNGILRSIRAVFSWNKLQYKTVLVGMKIDPDCIDDVANEINSLNEVTHNYSREGIFNLWFTLIYNNNQFKESLFLKLKNLKGVKDLREFNAEKTYKIGLVLDV